LGDTGTVALDLLGEIVDFADAYRRNVKEHLAKHPNDIPHYGLETVDRRVLSRDAVAVFEALSEVLPNLSHEEFLFACAPTISGLTSLLESGGTSADSIAAILEKALGGKLLQHDIGQRLLRDREEGERRP
jgi:hypothetical protein